MNIFLEIVWWILIVLWKGIVGWGGELVICMEGWEEEEWLIDCGYGVLWEGVVMKRGEVLFWIWKLDLWV